MTFVVFLVKNSRTRVDASIVVQSPRIVFPQIWPFPASILSETPHNGQIDCLLLWKEFRVDNITTVKENNQHTFDFRAASTWFFRFRLVIEAPFRNLLADLHVKFINLRLVTRNAFHECRVRIGSFKYVFSNLFAVLFLKKIAEHTWGRLIKPTAVNKLIDKSRQNYVIISYIGINLQQKMFSISFTRAF